MKRTLLTCLVLATGISNAEQNISQAPLKVHETPNENANIIAQINPSNGITILPNNWVMVKDMSTNKVGWVTQNELNQAMQQDNIWVKKIESSPTGKYQSVSEIKTGKSANEEYQSIINEVKEQRQHMNENFTKAMRQIKQIEESIFETSTPSKKLEQPQKDNKETSYWSSFLHTKMKP